MHILNGHRQLVETVGCITDLQGQPGSSADSGCGHSTSNISAISFCGIHGNADGHAGIIRHIRRQRTGIGRSYHGLEGDGASAGAVDGVRTNSRPAQAGDGRTGQGNLTGAIDVRGKRRGGRGRVAAAPNNLNVLDTVGDGSIRSDGTLAQGAIKQVDAVEVGGVGNPVDFGLELAYLLLQVGAVGLVVIGAVGGLVGQLHHAVEHVVDLGEGALGGLHQVDAALGVVLCGLKTGDLSAHLLADGKAGGVVAGTVDLVAGRQLLKVLGQGAGVAGIVTIGVHRHNVVLYTHDK
ncbi:hypothetical protein SDC9_150086 [bioreactor metagenome]|uniref:Uncharacterized protein n=1 Tax=bioreactor metagenome TaxID=1076179 RepID=A0A645ELE4_9ZZZZ